MVTTVYAMYCGTKDVERSVLCTCNLTMSKYVVIV